MKSTMRKRWMVIAGAAVFLLAAAGCGSGGGANPPGPTPSPKALTLVNYQSCGELETEIKAIMVGEMEANADGLRSLCRYRGGGYPVQTPSTPTVGGTAAAESGSSGATSTNLQEAGVDEADLVKTDGSVAYAIVGGAIEIVRVWPFADFKLLATITPAGQPSGLYLADGKLIILSSISTVQPPSGDMPVCIDIFPPPPGCGGAVSTTLAEEVYDVSTPAAPALLKSKTYSGTLVDSRRIGARLYLVLDAQGIASPALTYELDIPDSDLPDCGESGEPQPNDVLLASIERLKQQNRAVIAALSLSDLLPIVGDGKEIGCADVARSPSAAGMQLLSIVTDAYADAAAVPQHTALLSNGGAVYASPNALYVTASSVPYEWWTWWTVGSEFEDVTVIHRFAIDGGTLAYSGSGKVDGHLLDNGYAGSRYSTRFSMAQFALSEHEGYLRVASTKEVSQAQSGDGSVSSASLSYDNRITVLDAKSATLDKVGEVSGFGDGEWIHAVRFIGTRGYVVTFQKTDPLFVIDLSTPSAPAVEGELSVPGFSTYLHPLDDTHLIGLGFAADDMGSFAWTQGLKLALFDVTDPTAPSEVNHRELGSRGSYSAAVEEHHAFTLDPLRGMLALPVDLYEGGTGGSNFGTHTFSGVMLFKADLTGSFATIGKIAIADPSQDAQPAWWTMQPANILRTVILGDGKDDGIITLTTSGVQENRIDATMSQVGKL